MKPRDPDAPRPEDALPLLCEMAGDDLGQRIYLALIRLWRCQRVNFAKRLENDLLARAIYEMKSGGRTTIQIGLTFELNRRTVERLYKRELLRRRNMSEAA